jgi:hypothetical protein
MATIQSARRTLSAWSQTQRRALSMSANATPSERARSDVDHVEVLAATTPASWRPGDLGRATGLTDREVADALADAEDAGLIEPGSSRTGRVGIVVPSVLAALGVGGYGLALEDVRADVRPAGYAVELSDDDLTAAFA